MNVLVTGSSSGLGHGLATHFAARGAHVYGLSRNVPEAGAHFRHAICDLSEGSSIAPTLERLLSGVETLGLVVLNAGTLGRVQDMSRCTMNALKTQMDVNLWANKIIFDFLIRSGIQVKQVIAISSGASVSGALGWNGYALSKAALNMMMKLYANEMRQTHLCALAPGLVDTPMLHSILYGDHDTKRYTTVERLRRSKEEGLVLTPAECAGMIDNALAALRTYPSGDYIDLRNFSD